MIVCLLFNSAVFADRSGDQQKPSTPTGDPNSPVDPERAAFMSIATLVVAAIAIKAAPVVLFLGYLFNQYWQFELWTGQYMVEQSLLSQWTMYSLLEMDYQIRGAVRAAEEMITKLEEDVILLDKRAMDPSRDFDMANLDRRLQKEVMAQLAWIDSPAIAFKAKGKELEALFDAMRRRIIAGNGVATRKLPPRTDGGPGAVASYFTADLISENWELGKKLVAYAQLAIKVEERLLAPVTVPVKSGDVMVDRPMQASSMEHARLLIANNSKDLVFFVRNRTTDAAGAKVTKGVAGTERWIVLYPKGAVAQVAQAHSYAPQGAPDAQPPVLTQQLPFIVWLPVKPGDSLEVRVATYGEQRQLMRWAPVRGTAVRPDGDSIPRNFYYRGYETAWLLTQIPSRYYAMSEEYQWRFQGSWGNTPTFEKTDESQLRAHTRDYPLTLVRDRIQWVLPATLAELQKIGEVIATVVGRATIAWRTKNKKPIDYPDTGAGDLNIIVQMW
jgi:hypothetical protein